MLVLAIDTSTEVGSIALMKEGELLKECLLRIPGKMLIWLTSEILRMLESFSLKMEDVTDIAVGLGPGSFTGSRLALSTAKTLAQVRGIAIWGISTLDVIAYQAIFVKSLICPMIDARRGQLYTAFYKSDTVRIARITDYMALTPEMLVKQINNMGQSVVCLGDRNPYQEYIKDNLKVPFSWVPAVMGIPRASYLASLAYIASKSQQKDELFNLRPIYVRRPDAEIRFDTLKG